MMINLVLAVLLGLAMPSRQNPNAKGSESPRDFLEEFLKMELAGARLKPADEKTVSSFFVEPMPLTSPVVVFIVSDDFELNEISTEQSTARISTFFHEYYGKLDPAMRFIPAPRSVPGGGIVKKGITSDYQLVKTRRSTENKSDADDTTSRWKIVKAQAGPTIDLAAAVDYVKAVRAKTTDTAVKRNADRTLASLTKLR